MGFGGSWNGGSGGGKKYGKFTSKDGKPMTMEEIRKQMSGEGKSYKQQMEEQLIQYKVDLIKRASMHSDREMSEGTKEMLDKLANKMAEKEYKKLEEKYKKVEIEARRFGMAGHMDAKGRIYNAYRQIVLQVDIKSGYVVKATGWGGKFCKYDPKNLMCINKIARFLAVSNEQEEIRQRGGNSIWSTTGNDEGGNQGWW